MFQWKNWRFLASVKMAVMIIISLGVLVSVGTFVEAEYNAEVAKKWVYNTFWMYFTLGALCVNLIAVMVDRWPWQRRHGPFVCAHIGILIMLLGGLLTAKLGLDGTMRVPIGESGRWVSIPVQDLTIWSSFDGDQFTKLVDRPVDFFLEDPSENPIEVALDSGVLKVNGYKPFVLPNKKVVISESEVAGPGLRFQLQNDRVNVVEWILQKKRGELAVQDFGPATLFWGSVPEKVEPGKNQIHLEMLPSGNIRYAIFDKEGKATGKGTVPEGAEFSTGWMGLQFKVLRVLPKAEQVWEFKELARPTEMSTSAIRVVFKDKEHWLQQNDVLKLFHDTGVYIVTYGNRRLPLGFQLQLLEFEIGRYQGTRRAASYQSQVMVPAGTEIITDMWGREQKVTHAGVPDTLISMNEPLKFMGRTVYQASFEEDPETGRPIASIFSVNHDPGRFLKYLGSLILSLGVVWLFYEKRKITRRMAPEHLSPLGEGRQS